MGEVHSIFKIVDGWIQELKGSKNTTRGYQVSETKNTIETNDATLDREIWRQAFLVDAPALRDLLFGVSTENNLFDTVCTINRLIFFYVIIKWINFEVWARTGADPFILNQ
ncbi:hypothetical protein WH47_00578 [Habropoda laboriosa]|uniref:Uncharacterized protein n=1 Tax=Habropoda laboriosa TaxID=597456 RepID=A0A0L7RI12_9HYME|nr:hypothetical protein WH47_00578 [Habropoda laboriosa]